MTSSSQVGSTRLGVSGEMTGRKGGASRRCVAFFAAAVLLLAAAPGTNWTNAPVDSALASGGYALVRVGHGAAGAVAALAVAAVDRPWRDRRADGHRRRATPRPRGFGRDADRLRRRRRHAARPERPWH